MPAYGYTLFSELNAPTALVEQAVGAERAGFDSALISDHFHPWLASHTDSPFAWSVLGAAADRTDRIRLGTLVTCPFLRYHPAIVAQAAATVQVMSGGRFALGLGAGENLNEHVVGRGWPPVDVRHQMLEESIEAIRRLWTGDFVTYRGRHVTVEDASIYTLPDEPPPIAVAASGPESASLAGRAGDALVGVEASPELVQAFEEAGGAGKPRLGQVALAWDRDEERAREQAMRFAFGVHGWEVMADLPTPRAFDAAASTVRPEDVLEHVPAGPEPKPHAEAITAYLDAGFDEVAVVQVGDDHEGFLRFWERDLRPLLPD